MIFGLIPAAGKSERMGRPKLALRVGERTVLEHVIAALRDGGVDHVLVVLAPHVAQMQTIAQSAGAEVLVLPEQTPAMRSTVLAGLDWLQARHAPALTDCWILAPADHPAMDPQIVRQLIDAGSKLPPGSIVVPTWLGKRGHPTLIGWSHVELIRRFHGDVGLNVYLRSCQDQTTEIQGASGDVLLDLDTPEDYERLSGKQ